LRRYKRKRNEFNVSFRNDVGVSACKTRTVKYSGLNDLMVGVNQVVLYTNGEFFLELGSGGNKGNYTIISDTVYLRFVEKDIAFLPKKTFDDR
jgi:hypothetical protein